MQILSDFRLHRPASVEEAVQLRAELGDGAALYAGGTELLLALKLGVLEYEHLIDLKRIPALKGIEVRDGALRIGAGATHREIETSPLVAEHLPALSTLARHVANVRVRAAGTLAGNLAFAEPHADPAALLVALGATVELVGSDGPRSLPVEEFVLGAYETDLGEDELIEAFVVPLPQLETRATYLKFQVLERPTVGVAAVARNGGAPTVVVGAVDEKPVRVEATGEVDAYVDAAREAVDPVDDLSGSAEYKRHLTGVLVRRALEALAA
ncbi:MAG TPA: FAD binding domain-containing protein [Gaiellaceae bacterium]|nr:FAD binding domain-containing protein [Gaiellaceae bacterium]